MTQYNDLGIGGQVDWPRVKHLFKLGLFAATMVMVGDMLLGWGTSDPELTGLARKLSAYLALSDRRLFWSALLGLIGIPLEGLCYFGVYRLIAPQSPRLAHAHRSGVLGYLIFGGCGVHVPCLACAYFSNHMAAVNPEGALAETLRFGEYFLLPGTVLFFVFFVVLSAAQIAAFAGGHTPYPRWCWVFCLPVGMALALLSKLAGNVPAANAISAGWISVGNLWMFAGLLLTAPKAEGRAFNA